MLQATFFIVFCQFTMATFNSLADLKKVSKTLKAQAQEMARQEKERQEKALKAKAEANCFASAMKSAGIKPMAQKNLADTNKPKPAPTRRQNDDDVANPAIKDKLSDQEDRQTFLSDEDDKFQWRPGISPDIPRKLYRGFWTVQAWVDLHGYTVDEARVQLIAFLDEARRRHYRCLRIVHGVGYNSNDGQGRLRELVPRWLKQRPDVMAFVRSPANQGDQGALLVLLENTRDAH